MTDDRDDMPEVPDVMGALLSALTGKCKHELQLMRLTTVLGLLAARAGGRIEIDLKEVEHLDGKAIAVQLREDLLVVELMDATPEVGVPEPTHPAPPTRQ